MRRAFNVKGVVLVVVAAIGLTVWFAIPHERAAQAADASKCGVSVGCPENVCCGDIIGQSGGCSAENCCGGSETHCDGTLARAPHPFPQVRIDGTGCCLAKSADRYPKCTYFDCEGSLHCAAGDCKKGDEAFEVRGHKSVCRGNCPMEAK
ncbi:MAG: hypothetical protein WBE26_07665 [Phycisphaerae bacterium]